MHGFLFHFCKTTSAMCMAHYKERGHIIIIITIIHFPVLEADVELQFFVYFFKPHFATEQSMTFMDVSWFIFIFLPLQTVMLAL